MERLRHHPILTLTRMHPQTRDARTNAHKNAQLHQHDDLFYYSRHSGQEMTRNPKKKNVVQHSFPNIYYYNTTIQYEWHDGYA